MSYRRPQLRWLVPLAEWLRERRRAQAFRFGMDAGRRGYDVDIMARGIWPRDEDLRHCFHLGWIAAMKGRVPL